MSCQKSKIKSETKFIIELKILDNEIKFAMKESTGVWATKGILRSNEETYEPIISHPMSPQ